MGRVNTKVNLFLNGWSIIVKSINYNIYNIYLTIIVNHKLGNLKNNYLHDSKI